MNTPLRILVLRNAMDKPYQKGNGKSGGDSIFQECLAVWSNQSQFESAELLSCTSGLSLSKDQMLPNRVVFHELVTPRWLYSILPLLFLYKTVYAFFKLLTMKIPDGTWLFSSSDIFPDTIPIFLIKLFRPKLKWLAAFYFFAPKPGSADFSYRGLVGKTRGIVYYLSQRICFHLIVSRANRILLCNEVDRKPFADAGYPNQKMIAIYGGVRLAEAMKVSEPKDKDLSAIFMARFHSQKGSLLAVKVWKRVLNKNPNAVLGMIGMGPEEEAIRELIRKENLENKIILFGFQDGAEKYTLLKRAKLFFHPAVYETGGMAAAEGMAAGLPVVAYDHEGFFYCYPKGMWKVKPIGDEEKMSEAILNLLASPEKLLELKKEAWDLVLGWDWEKRAETIYQFLR